MIYQKLKAYAPERLACAYGGVLLALAAAVLSVGSYYLLYGFLKKILVTGDLAGALTLAWQIVGCLVASTVVYFAAGPCTTAGSCTVWRCSRKSMPSRSRATASTRPPRGCTP